MAVAGRPSPVRRVSKDQAIRELQRSVQEKEQAYELTSAEMAQALEDGQYKETAEICFWMVEYARLLDLQNGHRE
jgi:hypothetical protein